MTHKKTKKQKFLLTIFFCLLVVGGFGLGRTVIASDPNDPNIATPTDEISSDTPDDNDVYFDDNQDTSTDTKTTTPAKDTSTKPSINDQLINDGYDGAATGGNYTGKLTPDEVKDASGNGILDPVKLVLLGVLNLMGFLIRVAAGIFNYIIDSKNMLDVINNDVIYETWAMVRDTLNVAFILVLLFSAFSTVFQVDKYSYKKLLLTLVLMALLVNFSFPITRFIIDFSNSLMYYLLNTAGLGISDPHSIFPTIAKNSELQKILGGGDRSYPSLLAAILFTWILGITLLIIAGLFVIRIVALAILIIFSPIAFTGSIIPFSASYASKWWDALFKYAFFGPVMIFMLGVAVKMMAKIQLTGMSAMIATAKGESANPTFLASACFFIIPIIILWAGIIFAQQMSLMGASAVIGRGQKFMKWAPAALAGGVGAGAWWGAKQTGYPGGIAAKWDNYKKTGRLFGSNIREDREARKAGKGPFKVPGVIDGADAKRITEAEERLKTKEMGVPELQNLSKTGNKFEQAAAIKALAEKEKITGVEMDKVKDAFGETSQAFKQLVNKVKIFNPATAFAHITNDTDRMTHLQEFTNSNQFDNKKLNIDALGNDEFMEVMIANDAMPTKDIMDISKSSPGKKAAIKGALSRLTAEKNVPQDALSQKVHLANFALNGTIEDKHSDFAPHIFSNGNSDTMANITDDTARRYSNYMVRYNKNYKKTLEGIRSDTAKIIINKASIDFEDTDIPSLPADQSLNASSVKRTISADPKLSNLN